MYSAYPKRDRVAVKTALIAAWGFTGLAGLGALFLTPQTVTAEIGDHLPLISGLILLFSSSLAGLGVLINRYQFEWVAAWFAASGQFAYVLTVWALVFTSTPSRLQQAASLTSLIAFYVYRICICAAHARKQREIHDLVVKGVADARDVDIAE